MRRIFIAVMALVFNTFLFSCTNEPIAETDHLYETQATEGDDGEVEQDPDA